MVEFWSELTDAQASLLSTALLILAGGIGVLLSSTLFGGKVKNLETALKATEDRINSALGESANKVEALNNQLNEKLSSVDVQFSAALEALAQLRNSLTNIQESAEEQADTLRSQLKTHWYAIQTALEEIASDPKIHGKTRARYSKIPRYDMGVLLKTLVDDRNIDDRANDFKEAIHLWTWHRNGKPPLPQGDVEKMRDLAMKLVPSYRPPATSGK